ncbi:DUF4279 domain-containing protein [Lelliottia sp. JS-SCA-14]|uniref:DUF4279 domain-containing protein n=1 Tax=Lelliottia sp. JS-SCA-14 TaxID=3110110 RepID=UPI002D79B20F|nr:DUF4279 domain-containing protein [Lelliottia sp. JS-SCA-14]
MGINNEIMSTSDSMMTPVAHDYSTCSECYTELSIYTGNTHPQEITRLLGIKPTQVNVLGDKIVNSRGKTREIKLAGWFLSSKTQVNSKDLREHIDWILMLLSPVKVGLSEVQHINGVKITLRCTWRSKFDHGGPVLWPHQMAGMAELGLECSFDIYFDDEDESY